MALLLNNCENGFPACFMPLFEKFCHGQVQNFFMSACFELFCLKFGHLAAVQITNGWYWNES
jgi:hypothetical protein